MQLINKDKILNVLSHFKGDALLLYGTRFGAVMLQSITLFIIAAFVNMEEFGRFSFMFSAARVVSVVVGIGGAPFLHRELPYRDEKYEGAGNCRIFIKTLLRPVLIVWVSIPLCLFVFLESWDNLRSNRIKQILDAGVFELAMPIGGDFAAGDTVIQPGRHFYNSFPRGIKYGTINRESTVFKAAIISYMAQEEVKRFTPFIDPLNR